MLINVFQHVLSIDWVPDFLSNKTIKKSLGSKKLLMYKFKQEKDKRCNNLWIRVNLLRPYLLDSLEVCLYLERSLRHLSIRSRLTSAISNCVCFIVYAVYRRKIQSSVCIFKTSHVRRVYQWNAAKNPISCPLDLRDKCNISVLESSGILKPNCAKFWWASFPSIGASFHRCCQNFDTCRTFCSLLVHIYRIRTHLYVFSAKILPQIIRGWRKLGSGSKLWLFLLRAKKREARIVDHRRSSYNEAKSDKEDELYKLFWTIRASQWF